MSLCVAVHKDIGEYREKVIGKLSGRTLACVVGGLATSLVTAAICTLYLGIAASAASAPVMCASVPFWLAGFWRPHGMYAEQFLPLLWEHLTKSGVLFYTSSGWLHLPTQGLAQKTTRRHWYITHRKGVEFHETDKKKG